MKKQTTLTLFFFCFALMLQAQISVVFPDSKKTAYQLGETIHVHILLKSLPETCLDGMKQSKVFVQGLKIKEQTAWKQIAKAQFLKEVTLEVLSGTKKTAKLTILRKVDKENLFHQESFPILSN
jgi:hypothetical protein